jgi:hypothetical protein
MAKGKRPWTAIDVRILKHEAKAKTPVFRLSKQMKRTTGALRQKAFSLGLPLGHQQRGWHG